MTIEVYNHDILQLRLEKVQDKERILESAREKDQVTCKGKYIRQMADFSEGTLNIRRSQNDILWVQNEHNYQPRLLY